MEEKNCKYCEYYLQHYIMRERSFVSILCGHCTNRKPHGRIRNTDKICEEFTPKNIGKKNNEKLLSINRFLIRIENELQAITQVLKQIGFSDEI